LGNFIHLFSGVKKYERTKRGVQILINKKWRNSVKIWGFIDEKILRLNMNVWGYILTFIGVYVYEVYAPNVDNGCTVKDELLANLNKAIENVAVEEN
jgi:hypothetical protein